MPALPDILRSQLEKTVIAARDAAEQAARAALESLAVAREDAFPGMTGQERQLRRALRAKAAQLGGQPIKYGGIREGWDRLVEEIAYEQWHRMLFARVLAENNLLMHPEGVAVTLAECDELAAEEASAEGAADGWDLAARYAARMVPGLFAEDDPAAQVRFAPEGRRRLEALLTDLPPALFTADDSLGWVYQFWQSKKKEEVNRSERKIGGADLYPVTQLFTEDYMVQFLLQNSLGAWWAARHPESPLIAEWSYLRWREETTDDGRPTTDNRPTTDDRPRTADSGPQTADGGQQPPSPQSPIPDPQSPIPSPQSPTPAAGTFPGWPDRAAAVTMMDPCGGSGHFVVAGFEMLRRMRMEEEGLGEAEAADRVIRDNLFMLEIDPRCTQIAAFALALAAWKAGGYRDLPTPNIACSGIAVEGQLDEWLRLAGDDARLRAALERLYHLFKQAPTLGSLINPADLPAADKMFSADYHEVAPLLEAALAREGERDDPAAAVLGDATRGVLKAARLLAGKYTLVATNVPYLSRSKHNDELREYASNTYPDAKSDLATMFLERCREFTLKYANYALVTPQGWLNLRRYTSLREKLLKKQEWNCVATLGSGAFETISGEVVNVALLVYTNTSPSPLHNIAGIDVSDQGQISNKVEGLKSAELVTMKQSNQLGNPDARVVLDDINADHYFSEISDSRYGLRTGDFARFGRSFWELPYLRSEWKHIQSTVKRTIPYGGRESVILWQNGIGDLKEYADLGIASLQGAEAWGRKGIIVSLMGSLPCTLYTGHFFDNNVAALWTIDEDLLPIAWAYCSSSDFPDQVRRIDQSIKVTNLTLLKVPFDLPYWQSVAEEQYPDGLPEPWSNDPTQWLFGGHPVGSTEPLHVAVARLLGYRWPGVSAADHSGNGPGTETLHDDPLVHSRNEDAPHSRNEDAPHSRNESHPLDDLDRFADADGIVCLPPVAGEQPAAQRLRALLAHAYNHPPILPDFEKYRVGDFVPTSPVMPERTEDGGRKRKGETVISHQSSVISHQSSVISPQSPIPDPQSPIPSPLFSWSAQVERKLLDAVDAPDLDSWLRTKFFAQHCRLFGNRPFLWHIWDGRNDGFSAIVNYHKLDAATLDKLIYTYLGSWIRDQRDAVAKGEAGADARLVAAEALKEKLEAIRAGEPPYDIYVRWKPLHAQPIGWTPDLNDGVRQNIRPFVEAGVLRRRFTINWTPDRGKNPDGSARINDLHYTRAQKLAARQTKGDA